MIVSNSSPIIVLGKLGRLELLRKCFGKIIIPESVHKEILRKGDSPETAAVKKAADEKWLSVEKTESSSLLITERIGQGEKEAISLAAKNKTLLLIDDDSAKAYASILGVEAHGTLYAIYASRLRSFITKAEAKDILDGIIKGGFYISTELYSEFFKLLDSTD